MLCPKYVRHTLYPLNEDTSLYRTLYLVPKVSTLEGFHSIPMGAAFKMLVVGNNQSVGSTLATSVNNLKQLYLIQKLYMALQVMYYCLCQTQPEGKPSAKKEGSPSEMEKDQRTRGGKPGKPASVNASSSETAPKSPPTVSLCTVH